MFKKYGTEPGKAAPGNSETTPKEKAAGVLHTPTTASKELSAASIPTAQKTGNPDAVEYARTKSEFALAGRTLTRARRAHDGRVSFVVTGWHGSRYFSHWHDVLGHLAALGGKP